MNNKIIIGSIFASILLLSLPVVSSIQEQTVINESIGTKEEAVLLSENYEYENTMTLEEIITFLQYFIDHYLYDYDEDVVQELQDNIIILKNGPGDSLFCKVFNKTVNILVDIYLAVWFYIPIWIQFFLSRILVVLVAINEIFCYELPPMSYSSATNLPSMNIQSNSCNLCSDSQQGALSYS